LSDSPSRGKKDSVWGMNHPGGRIPGDFVEENGKGGCCGLDAGNHTPEKTKRRCQGRERTRWHTTNQQCGVLLDFSRQREETDEGEKKEKNERVNSNWVHFDDGRIKRERAKVVEYVQGNQGKLDAIFLVSEAAQTRSNVEKRKEVQGKPLRSRGVTVAWGWFGHAREGEKLVSS